MKFLILLFFLNMNLYSLKIEGEFSGWDQDVIVKLDDGSIWQQVEYYYYYCYKYNPEVELYSDNGSIYIKIKGCDGKDVKVKKISSHQVNIDNKWNFYIDDYFKGFKKNNIYKLNDGSFWQQVSNYNYIYNKYNPQVRLYEKYGDMMLSIKDCNCDDIIVKKVTEKNSSNKTYLLVKNNSDYEIYYCFGFNNNGLWDSKGWFKVDANSYYSISLGDYIGYCYLYAEYNDGEKWWGDDQNGISFCIHKRDSFQITNANKVNCTNNDYKVVKMKEVYLSGNTYIWTLK